MITELLQQPGTFSISLKPGTPVAIRRAVAYSASGIPYGHISITPQRIPPQALTRATVLASACYTGRIQQRSNLMHTFAGNGIGVWLGDAENKANLVIAYGGGAPYTMSDLLTYVLTTVPRGNGLTKGSATFDTGATLTSPFANAVPADMFNQVGDQTGNAWVVNANGTVDEGAPASLFHGTPVCIILRGDGGREPTIFGMSATQLDVTEDFDDYATYCFVTGTGFTGSGSVATPPKDFTGGTDSVLEIGITTDNNSGAACNASATSYLNLHKSSRRQVRCSVRNEDIRQRCRPGDQLYVFDPETDLVDTANKVPYRGSVLYPVTAQLRGYTWPVVQGMGVYSIQTQDASNTVLDLTDFMAWETGDVSLELGAPSRPAVAPRPPTWGDI